MRLAQVIVVGVLAALASVYVLAGVPAAILAFSIQVAFVLRWRSPWLLAVQAAVVFSLTCFLGVSVGVLGFLGGGLLLGRRSRLLAPLVVAAGAAIDFSRHGRVLTTVDATITVVLGSLVCYGLARLIDRVRETHTARLALISAAVAEERLRIAAELSDGLGRGVSTILYGCRRVLTGTGGDLGELAATSRTSLAEARAASASYRAMSLTPEITTARAMLAAAGIETEVRVGHEEPLGPVGALLATVLREAVTEVVRRGSARVCAIETTHPGDRIRLRVTDDGRRTADDEGLADLPQQVSAAGGTLTTGISPEGRFTVEATLPAPPRAPAEPERAGTAVMLLAAVLVGFSVKALLQLPAGLLLPATVLLGLIVVLQLRSVHGRHMLTLAGMAVLAYAPIPMFGPVWLGAAGFLAGPVLLALPWRVAWPLVGAIMASVAGAAFAFGLPVPVTVNLTISTLVTGLVIYSLLRLAQLVRELHAARESLARSAVVEERLRAARDLHDLLGHSLAAILLKVELARRLPDPAEELAEVIAMAERAEADLRSVSGDQRELSLATEAAAARSFLGTAGVEVTLDLGHPELPPQVETVLATVLREALTNVLRHSDARRCVIETFDTGLRVRNDGVRSTRARSGSSGIGNLTTRLAVLHGSLTTSVEDGWFELEASLRSSPIPSRS